MLIIPEIETVVILPPRTGSGSLYRAVLAAYPKAFMPYRHMEADGVPFGYDRWRRLGVLRHPVARLWSLYHYLQTFGIKHAADKPEHADYHRLMRRSVQDCTFEEWLVENQEVFTCHLSRFGGLKTHPAYAVLHASPETRKSQFTYLRPDLGTEIVPYRGGGGEIAQALGITLERTHNVTGCKQSPWFDDPVASHIRTYHGWDLEECQRRGIWRV